MTFPNYPEALFNDLTKYYKAGEGETTLSKVNAELEQLASQLNVDLSEIHPSLSDLDALAGGVDGRNGTPGSKFPYQFGGGIGPPADAPMYEISQSQHWVMVGVLMPIVIALYLLLILVCYYLFCKHDTSQWNDTEMAHDVTQVTAFSIFILFAK